MKHLLLPAATVRTWLSGIVCAVLAAALPAAAVAPVVKTVPWVAGSPLIPHNTWSGKTITLKGTSDQFGGTISYTWDFGDGSPVVTGPIPNTTAAFKLEATHAYVGSVGTVFSATLTVSNSGTGESASQRYYVEIFPQTLEVEINVAIDEGLWNIHKAQTRTATDAVWPGHYSSTAANVNAFEINGHLETGGADNPYVETVARGLRRVFTYLARFNIGAQPLGNPDSNGNGFGIYVPQWPYDYQVGIMIDCLVATGTPNAIAPTGPADVVGRTYKDIVQDMVDYYAFSQYDFGGGGYPVLGGWRYGPNEFPDNSAAQWAAVGLIPAEHIWGCTVPAWVRPANLDWLRYSQDTTGSDAGVFGYTGPSPIFGPFGTTPSGMVQLAMVGVGRGDIMWDRSETFMRDNFGNAAGEGQYWLNVK
ncbi:MAG: PKD domain-containing protein, partial [Limisphaerales bacterium]